MEAHPVPKNVLDVEFKLFGSLSVRQFGKVLIGALIGLVLYLLPIPGLIAIPMIIVSVLTGVAAALIPAFEVRITALVKSVFVSPRYVWRKGTEVPDVLDSLATKQVKQAAGIQKPKVTKQEQASIDDLSIDQILEARSAYAAEAGIDGDGSEDPNFSRVYEQQFANQIADKQQSSQNQRADAQAPITPNAPNQNLAGTVQPRTPNQVQVGGGKVTNIQTLNNATPREKITEGLEEEQKLLNQNRAHLSAEQLSQYQVEISELRKQLNTLNKQDGTEDQRQEILARVSEIYKLVGVVDESKPKHLPSAGGVVGPSTTKTLYGVVVDKKEQPMPSAVVKILDINGTELGPEGISAEDGRVAIPIPEELDEFFVKVDVADHKFYPFKVKIVDGRLPAYKFKEHS